MGEPGPCGGAKIAARWQQLPRRSCGAGRHLQPYAGKIGGWCLPRSAAWDDDRPIPADGDHLRGSLCGGSPPAAASAASLGAWRANRGRTPRSLPPKAIRGVALGVVSPPSPSRCWAGSAGRHRGAGRVRSDGGHVRLCIAQIGPILVLLPSIAWLFCRTTGDGGVLVAWTIVVGAMDNFLRPVLIKKGLTCRCC